MEELVNYSIKPFRLNYKNRVLFFQYDEIRFINSQNKNLLIHILNTDTPYIVRGSLKYFEQILPNNQFFRCHYSYIVNLLFIKEFNTNEKNLILENGETIPVSRSGIVEFNNILRQDQV